MVTPSPFRSKYQTPGGNISPLVANFPNFHFEECDGTDLLASLAAMRRAVEYIRSGHGPALVHGHVIRVYSHSLSDDQQLYRPESERKQESERDPITRLQKFLLAEGILDAGSLQQAASRGGCRGASRLRCGARCSLPRAQQLRPLRLFGGVKTHRAGLRFNSACRRQ